ncbi:Uncharacterized protein PBTT_06222 [Plasmodiophora brassicae]|uniref:Uncharacterized protein n=1 Tax=Plasmodiophora brassicae TaxID=37360 RepID=A0A0G4IUP4_PLABS|nr:hypothetical protein PBRA_007109 [Plasmodiophora brassicae]
MSTPGVIARALVVLSIGAVDGSLSFPSLASRDSPLAGLDLYAPPTTSFIGPQPDDPNRTRSGPIVLFGGDLCEPATTRAADAIILVTTEAVSRAACSYEAWYLSLYVTGAAAVLLPEVDYLPSLNMYSNDGSRGAHTRHLPMLFLNIGPSGVLYDALVSDAPGRNATVRPDVNVWRSALASWYYQLFVRILPSVVLIVSGMTAAVFLVVHMRIIDGEHMSDAHTVRQRSLPRRASFIWKALGLPHAVLAIEVATSTLSGAVLAIGGFYSTPNLPYPVLQYFTTSLGGWSLSASLLSASAWIRHLPVVVDASLATRLIRGDRPVAFALLLTVPVAIDTAGSVLFALYNSNQVVPTVVSALGFVFQLTFSLHVLVSVMHYYRTARRVRLQATRAAGDQDDGMGPVLTRLSRCVLGMSLSMILICVGAALVVASSAHLYRPSQWTICWTLVYNGRALDSAFRVAMFKPRPTSARLSTVAPALAVRVTSKK